MLSINLTNKKLYTANIQAINLSMTELPKNNIKINENLRKKLVKGWENLEKVV